MTSFKSGGVTGAVGAFAAAAALRRPFFFLEEVGLLLSLVGGILIVEMEYSTSRDDGGAV